MIKTVLMLLAFAFVLPLTLVATAVAFTGGHSWRPLVIVATMLTPVSVLGCILLLQNSVSLEDGVLNVRAFGFYRATIEAPIEVVARSRVVPLASLDAFTPKLRTNGVGLPGYLAGWFELRNGSRAFVLVQGSSPVRIFESVLDGGGHLLVSDALLGANVPGRSLTTSKP